MAIIPGKTYYLKLTANQNENELLHGASLTAENGVDVYCTAKLLENLQEWPPVMEGPQKINRCGECAHLRAMEGGSYNTEAYKRRPWGDCSVYAKSEEYKSIVENRVSGCGLAIKIPAGGEARRGMRGVSVGASYCTLYILV